MSVPKIKMASNVSDTRISGDTFFTPVDVAENCYNRFLEYLEREGITHEDKIFLEPSAGDGSFYNLMPEGRRIGVDIEPRCEGVIKSDFLEWTPPNDIIGKEILVVMNPPFGRRSQLIIAFFQRLYFMNVNHIGIIGTNSLNMQDVPKRLNKIGWFKVSNDDLGIDDYRLPNGKTEPINTIWQIWRRGRVDNSNNDNKTCHSFVKIYGICQVESGKQKLRNLDKAEDCDVFIHHKFNSIAKKQRAFTDIKDCEFPTMLGVHVLAEGEARQKIIKALLDKKWGEGKLVSTCSKPRTAGRLVCLTHEDIREVVIGLGYFDKKNNTLF